MNDPIKKYSSWLLEDKGDKSKKFVQKDGGTKVVFKPIDSESFLIKYRKLAIIDAKQVLIGQPTIVNGTVQKPKGDYLNTGWQQTFDLLVNTTDKGKGPNLELVEALRELGTSKILVYEVSRKLLAPNKIVVTFTIYDKSKFKAPIGAGEKTAIDPDIKTMEASTAAQYAIDNATAAKIRNTVLNLEARVEKLDKEIDNEEGGTGKGAGGEGAGGKGETSTGTDVKDSKTGVSITIKDPVIFKKLRYATANSSIFKIIDKALSKISRFSRQGNADPDIYDNATFKKSEEELEEGKIGDYTITVLSALKKAFGIVTKTERGVVEDYLNQDFANKLADIINAQDINDSVKYILDPFGKYLIEAAIYESVFGLADLLGSQDVLDKFINNLKNFKVITAKKESATATPDDLSKIDYAKLVYGVKDSEDLKKVQKLMIDKLTNTNLKGLSSKWWYANVVTNKTYAGDGDYGGSTRGAVEDLKKGFKLSSGDVNGNTITKELVDRLYAYNDK